MHILNGQLKEANVNFLEVMMVETTYGLSWNRRKQMLSNTVKQKQFLKFVSMKWKTHSMKIKEWKLSIQVQYCLKGGLDLCMWERD